MREEPHNQLAGDAAMGTLRAIMHVLRTLASFAAIILLAAPVRAELQAARGAKPAWAEPLPVPSASGAKATGGVIQLLSDLQRNEVEKTTFNHWARKFTAASGVQEGTRIVVDFAPAYQTLTFHQLVLHRDGQVLDRLEGARIRVLEREEGMSSFVYDGRATVTVDVEDVRVGDVLEYSFSVQGDNPVFDGVFGAFVPTAWSVPMVRFQYRLLWPADRFLNFQTRGIEPVHAVTRLGTMLEHTWALEKVPATTYDGDTPSWYSEASWIQLSGYRDWSEVVSWALQFYALDGRLPAALKAEVAKLAALPSLEERIVGVLEYVQEQIRYLSVSEGVHSHRPHTPEEVVLRGYGDCKDKALTLSAMLRALGVDAWPALVASSDRQMVAEMLPSPLDFDHVIVAVNLNSRLLWLDPTCENQGGRLLERFCPRYGKALVIREGETALSDVTPSGEVHSWTECETTFSVPRYSAPVQMDVRTTFAGRDADRQRSLLANTDSSQIAKNYLNYTARQFPGARGENLPSFEDFRQENRLTSSERYVIPKFWRPRAEDTANLYAEIYPDFIREVLQPPSTHVRTAPLGLIHPRKIREVLRFKMPEEGNFPSSDFRVDDPAFRYASKVRTRGQLLEVSYEYEALADSVPVDRVPQYLENLAKARENIGYPIMVPKHLVEGGEAPAPAFTLNWAVLLVAVFSILASLVGAVFYYRWRPAWPMPHIDPGCNGLSGWLILVGIGVVVRPILLVVALKDFWNLLNLEVWNTFTVPGQAFYDPRWAPLLFAELVVNLVMFVLSVLLIVLFFKKRRTFPPLFIAVLATLAIGALVEIPFAAPLAEKFPQLDLSSSEEAGRVVFQALIWIPYMLVSKRVRSTFVRGRPISGRRRESLPPPLPE